MEQKLRITPEVEIPLSELLFRFSRSSGAGGQNVNKVSTRVELLFDVSNSPSLDDWQKTTVSSRLKSRVGSDGVLRLSTQESRSQWRNRELIVKKFEALLSKALKQTRQRVSTRASGASREKRLTVKKLVSRKKQTRRRPDIE